MPNNNSHAIPIIIHGGMTEAGPIEPADQAPRHPTPQQVARWKDMTWADKLAASHYARAKRLNGGKPNGFWRGDWWLALLERARYTCVYCHAYSPRLEPDHALPLALGGSNRFENILPACPECNRRKSAKNPAEWFAPGELEALLAYYHPHHHHTPNLPVNVNPAKEAA